MFTRTLRNGLRSLNNVSQVQLSLRSAQKAFYSHLPISEQDSELLRSLEREMEFEKGNSEEDTPGFLKEFQKLKLFKIEDTPGNNEVVLTRDTSAEKITVTFSIDDINNAEEDEATEEIIMPVSTVITVQKKSSNVGALTFQAVVENGGFQITHITHTDDPKLAVSDDAESDYQRRGQYIGPIFNDLDETLSSAFCEYLDARK
ncbi:Mitochondrial acidic protein mam33, partial [Coelomomyces lativittatus]